MAGESKVAYEVDIQPGLCLDFINETDKIRIFGNLLDNALEACGKLSPGEDRWIRVQARPIKNVCSSGNQKLHGSGTYGRGPVRQKASRPRTRNRPFERAGRAPINITALCIWILRIISLSSLRCSPWSLPATYDRKTAF